MMQREKLQTSEALVQDVVLPCVFFNACDSPSKKLKWACSGYVKEEDRLKMCVFYNRFQNLEIAKPEDLNESEWIRILKRQIQRKQHPKKNRGKDRR